MGSHGRWVINGDTLGDAVAHMVSDWAHNICDEALLVVPSKDTYERIGYDKAYDTLYGFLFTLYALDLSDENEYSYYIHKRELMKMSPSGFEKWREVREQVVDNIWKTRGPR